MIADPDPHPTEDAAGPRAVSGMPVKSGAWSVVLRVIGTGLALLVGIQLARYLGPAGLGLYALAVAIVMPLASIAQFGLPMLAVRELAISCEQQDGRKVRAILVTFAALTFWFGVLAALFLGATALAFLTGSGIFVTLLLGALLLPFVALTGLFGAQLRGLNHLVRGQSLEIVARPAFMSLLLFIAWASTGTITPELAMGLSVASFAAATILGLAWLRHSLPPSGDRRRQTGEVRGWLIAAAPLSAAELLRQIDGVYAILVVGLLTTADQTGILRVAVSAVIIIAIPSSILHVIMAPNLARLYAAGDRAGLRAALSGSARIMVAALGTGLLVVALFGEWLLAVWFGSAFVSAWQPLLILTVAHLVGAFFGLGNVFLAMSGRERPFAVIQFIATAAGIAAAFPLVAMFGTSGAAWAVVLGSLTSGVLAWVTIRRQTGLDSSALGLPSSGAGSGQRFGSSAEG